jgi:hypothetical protein
MAVVVSSLRRLGFSSDALEIECRWAELVRRTDPNPSPESHRCYPDALLDICVTEALEATREIGCDLVHTPVRGLVRGTLNEAWNELWRDPVGYLNWERQAVNNLHVVLKKAP